MTRSHEVPKGERNPEKLDRIKGLLAYKKDLDHLHNYASSHGEVLFSSKDDAHEAAMTALQAWHAEHPNFTEFTTLVEASGEGVMVPNVGIVSGEISDDSGTVVQIVLPNEAVKPLEFFESASGFYRSLFAIQKHDEATESFKNDYYMIAKGNQSMPIEMFMGEFPYPFVTGSVNKTGHFMIGLNANTSIRLPELDEHEQRLHAIESLARQGIRKGNYIRELHKLNAALYQSHPVKFQEFKHVKRLQWLAKETEEFAAQPNYSTDVLIDALTATFGKDREMNLTGNAYDIPGDESTAGVSSASGVVKDILVYEQPDVTEPQPTLFIALESIGKGGHAKTEYFVMRELQVVEF